MLFPSGKRCLSCVWRPLADACQWAQVYRYPHVGTLGIRHPFVERLIGTLRCEYLDQLFFWNDIDLEHKLLAYGDYYNQHRCHSALNGETPNRYGTEKAASPGIIESYEWTSHCHGMFHLPVAGQP